MLINSLILILSYSVGLNFLIALLCVQIESGIRDLYDAFSVHVYEVFISEHRLLFEENLQIFPLAVFDQNYETVLENTMWTSFG